MSEHRPENNHLTEPRASRVPESWPQEDKDIAALLHVTVGHALDRHRGRAGAAFMQAVRSAEPGTRTLGGTEAFRGPGAKWLRLWAATASALAACLALVVGLQLWRQGPAAGTANPNPPAAQAAMPVMNQIVFTRDVDGGTVVREDAPMRVVRKQSVRRTEWFDPTENARYSVTEPLEKVGYERLQPY